MTAVSMVEGSLPTQANSVDTLVQLSLCLDRELAGAPITSLLLRSLQDPETAFVRRDAKGWFTRGIERFRSKDVDIQPYNLEANVAHFHALVKTAAGGHFTVSEGLKPALLARFKNGVPEALTSLQERMEALAAKSTKVEVFKTLQKTKALFKASFDLYAIVRDFLKDEVTASCTSDLVAKLFDQYHETIRAINRRLGEAIASQEERDLMLERLKKELLVKLQQRLSQVFELFQKEAIVRMKESSTIQAFHIAKAEIQEEIKKFIQLDAKMEHAPICKILCHHLEGFAVAVQQVEMPRYSELLSKEVLPQIVQFLATAEANQNLQELRTLHGSLGNYADFLEQAVAQLRCPNNATSCPESALLYNVLELLQKSRASIAAKLAKAPLDTTVRQLITGSHQNVYVAEHMTINHGAASSEVCLLNPPSFAKQALNYTSTILFSAAATYLTSGVSLAWSLVSGVAFTVAPSAVKIAARQMVPDGVVAAVDPVIDFAARLLIWRYGTGAIQALAGVREQVPAPQASPAHPLHEAVSQVANSAAVPIALGAIDVARRIPARVYKAKETKPLLNFSAIDAPGIIARAAGYLSALFWISKERRTSQF